MAEMISVEGTELKVGKKNHKLITYIQIKPKGPTMQEIKMSKKEGKKKRGILIYKCM